MTVIAEMVLSHQNLAMHETRIAVPEMRLHVENQTWDVQGRRRLFIWCQGGDFDAFESAVCEDPTVAKWEMLEDTGKRRLYRVDLSENATLASPARVEVGGSLLSVVATSDGIETEIRFPDHETMNEYIERVRDRDIDISIRRIFQSDSASDIGYGLSEKQRDALRTALDAGYYAIPREADLGAVADRLGISRQATSERLRRAVATLARDTVGSNDGNRDRNRARDE